MVMKWVIACIVASVGFLSLSAQENEVRRFPQINHDHPEKIYTTYDRGFWMAAEVTAGYGCRIADSNFGYTEIDVVPGYRYNAWLRAGLGLGARFYYDAVTVRWRSAKWVMPIFLNVRGNLIEEEYRDVVPFYSFDIGGTAQDGFMLRPSVGLRIGEKRSAFLIGLAYTGQSMQSYNYNDESMRVLKRKFVSFLTLKFGYEF